MKSQDFTDYLLKGCRCPKCVERSLSFDTRPTKPKRNWAIDAVIIFFVSLVVFCCIVGVALSMEVSLIPCDGGTCAIVNAKPEDQADYVLVEVFFEQAATIEKKEVKLLLHHQVTVPMVAGAHVASDPMGVDMKKIVRMKYTTLKRGEVKEQKITP